MPSPTYLVGLEIIVQRKLQFAQVLWLLLLLAFTFSFGQARFCIVIILGELRVGREGLNGEGSRHPNSESEPLWGGIVLWGEPWLWPVWPAGYKADPRNQHEMGEQLIGDPQADTQPHTWKT